MDVQKIEREFREEQLRQMRDQANAAKKQRERKLKQNVGDLLDSLYTL